MGLLSVIRRFPSLNRIVGSLAVRSRRGPATAPQASNPCCLLKSLVRQIAQQPPKILLCLAGLEPALERSADLFLCVGIAHAFGEEIRIAAKILDGCERNCIH